MTLLSFAVAIMSLIGVIRGRIWFVQGRGKSALGLVAAFALFIAGGTALSASSPKTSAPTNGTKVAAPAAQAPVGQPTSSAPAAPGPSIETQRADFKAWYDNVMAIHDRADKAYAQYQVVTKAMTNGTTTLVEAYSAIESIRDAQAAGQSAIYSVKPPTSLSKSDQEKLSKATEYLSTGLYSRRTALDKVLKYMDEQKPSLLSDAQGDIKMADSFMIQGLAPILEVQAALGIEATATP